MALACDPGRKKLTNQPPVAGYAQICTKEKNRNHCFRIQLSCAKGHEFIFRRLHAQTADLENLLWEKVN